LQGQFVNCPLCDAGQYLFGAALQNDHDLRGMRISRDALNVAAQLVLNACVLGLRGGQTDVTRQDPYANGFANGQACIAHPNAATLKVNARQMPLRIDCTNVA
jgi:hypothetical protein